MDDYENEALPVGEAQVAEAMQTLQRYKAGKAALDKRIVDNELWFRMGHWKNYQNPMMPGKAQPSSGWLHGAPRYALSKTLALLCTHTCSLTST